MAKNINHLQHVKSSVVENGAPKLPTPSVLVEGELAVNYAADYETISLKNSSGDVVTFSSDHYYTEKHLGSGFTGENSAVTVTQAINESEKVAAAALNDLNERKLDASAYTEPDLSEYATKEWVDEERLGSGFTGENSGRTVTEEFDEMEIVVSAALNDLNDRKLDASAYTETDLSDYYTMEEVDDLLDEKADLEHVHPISAITGLQDALDDKQDVLTFDDKPTSGSSNPVTSHGIYSAMADTELVIAAALNDLDDRKLDASAYTSSIGDFYTKEQVDSKLGADFSGTDYVQSVTEVINTIETVTAAALNDLNERKLDASAYTPTDLTGYATEQWVTGITTPLRNDVNTLSGNAITSATYSSTTKEIVFTTSTGKTIVIDATDFIKDGMVNEVAVDEPTSGSNSGVTCLIITFNTDAGKEDIEIPISEIFDSGLYYTKTQIDDVLGSGFTVSSVTSSITEVIKENELITASALNDLNLRKLDASAYTETDLTGYATEQWVNEERLGSAFTGDNSGLTVTEKLDDITLATSAALNDLNNRVSGNTTTIGQVNAKADTIARSLSGYTPSGYSYSKSEVDIKLNDKLDASAYTPTDLSGYYTKVEVDDKLGSGFTGENSGYTVTKAMNDTERVVAAALNDLNERKLDASAFTESVGDFYTKSEIDDFLGDWFTSSSAVSSVTNVIEENELIISQALNDLDERILEISGSSGSGGGSSVMLPIGGYFDYSNPGNSTLDFSNYTYSDIIDMLQSNQDVTFIDGNGQVYRSANPDEGCFEFIGQNAFYENEMGLRFPVVTFCDDGIYFDLVTIPASGGGGTGDLSGVTFNGVAATKSNGVAAITANVVSSVTMNNASKTITNGALNLGTVITAETQLSTASTGTGSVVTGLTVSNHQITTKMGNITLDNVANGSTRKLPQYYSETNTGDAKIQTYSEIYESGSNTGYIELSSRDSATNHPLSQLLLDNDFSKLECNYVDSDRDYAVTHSSYVECSPTGTVLDFKVDNTENKVVLDGAGFKYNNNTVATTNLIPTALSALTADATHRLVTDTEKTSWNNAANDSHVHGNLSVLEGITSQKVTNWDNAYTSAHSHSNKSVLDGIDTTKVGNWDNAATNAHNHDNKTILDNLTQAVIDNSHTHSNKTVLDGITTAKTAQWDNAISAVSFNGTDATVTNHKAAITATIPTSLSQLTSAHTHTISEVTNLQSTLNAKVSGITVNNGSKVTPTNGVANLTINASTVGALASGTTLDGIADGTTRKLSDYATTGTVNTHSGTTIPSATSSQMHLPAVTAADNGKILMVSGGTWVLVSPTTIYTGTGTPQSSQGNDGDIYLQTS